MSKKQEEFKYLEKFKSLYNDFPKGRIQKHESPDFILRPSIKRSIGIEITSLHLFRPDLDSVDKTDELITPEELRDKIWESIMKKEEKRKLYLKSRTDYLWLVIISENIIEPLSVNFNNFIERQNFISGFDKIFLLDLNKKKLFELP